MRDEALTSALLRTRQHADALGKRVDANALEAETIRRLGMLVVGGYKFIDITIRKDGQEHHFEGDWLARLFRDQIA